MLNVGAVDDQRVFPPWSVRGNEPHGPEPLDLDASFHEQVSDGATEQVLVDGQFLRKLADSGWQVWCHWVGKGLLGRRVGEAGGVLGAWASCDYRWFPP